MSLLTHKNGIDYKCALQKEILLQGHIYVSEHHVCFKSNIFGWVTNVTIIIYNHTILALTHSNLYKLNS
jgi:hypothetical protein